MGCSYLNSLHIRPVRATRKTVIRDCRFEVSNSVSVVFILFTAALFATLLFPFLSFLASLLTALVPVFGTRLWLMLARLRRFVVARARALGRRPLLALFGVSIAG